MPKLKVSKFDIAEYVDDEVMIEEYLNDASEEGNTEDFITAIGHIAKAKGMTRIASDTGMCRPSLYKSLIKRLQTSI